MKAGRELDAIIRDILEDMPPDCFRWLFCFFDESDGCYDCACCLMSRETIKEYQDDGHKCNCICHERIEKIAKHVAEELAALAVVERRDDFPAAREDALNPGAW